MVVWFGRPFCAPHLTLEDFDSFSPLQKFNRRFDLFDARKAMPCIDFARGAGITQSICQTHFAKYNQPF